jgi:FkbM family methyltransferase
LSSRDVNQPKGVILTCRDERNGSRGPEPVPDLYRQLEGAITGLQNVVTYPLAVSDTVGEATMHVSSLNDQSSSLPTPNIQRTAA